MKNELCSLKIAINGWNKINFIDLIPIHDILKDKREDSQQRSTPDLKKKWTRKFPCVGDSPSYKTGLVAVVQYALSMFFLLTLQDTLSSPLKAILHNKRFMKAPRTKLQSADYNVAGRKDSWEDEVYSRRYSNDRGIYWNKKKKRERRSTRYTK